LSARLLVEKVKTGRIDVGKIVQQLNQSRLHPLTILIREFAQNSWDARDQNAKVPVRFQVDGLTLQGDQVTALREDLFTDISNAGVAYLERVLNSSDKGMPVIILSDFNTVGLSGETNPTLVDPSGRSAWQSYLHDIGSGQEDAASMGGRYGLGRTSAYGVSKARTIVVYTRTIAANGEYESRLIAVSIDGKTEAGDKRLTGRVWWGKTSQDVAFPLTGQTADRVARRIGMPQRSAEQTGLSVMIIDPNISTETSQRGDMRSALEMVASATMWNLWPKADTKSRQMEFAVFCEGREIPIDSAREHLVLREFAELGDAVRRYGRRGVVKLRKPSPGVEITEITYFNEVVGHLALKPFAALRTNDTPDDLDKVGGIVAPVNHVLLMRQPELVVCYREMTAGPDFQLDVAGMFIPAPKFEGDFALAEPVAHDSWQDTNVPQEEDGARKLVRHTMRRIDDAYRSFINARISDEDDGDAELLRIATNELSQLLLPQPAEKVKQTGGGGGGLVSTKAGRVGYGKSSLGSTKGQQNVVWESSWEPTKSNIKSPKQVSLKFEVAPSGQTSNTVPSAEKGHPPIRLDRKLKIKRVKAKGTVEHVEPEIVIVHLANSADASGISLTIDRSDGVGVVVRVSELSES